MNNSHETSLGEGIYASPDRGMIRLWLPREAGGSHFIWLDSSVLQTLESCIDEPYIAADPRAPRRFLSRGLSASFDGFRLGLYDGNGGSVTLDSQALRSFERYIAGVRRDLEQRVKTWGGDG